MSAKGTTLSEEAKRKISERMQGNQYGKGNRHSLKHRASLVGNVRARGHKHTDEFKKRMSERMQGEGNPHYGSSRCGSENYGWKGGRRVNDGYVYIYSPEHPNANVNKVVGEHRLVMEKKLGRYLKPDEVVHHIDGDRGNNSPENLRVETYGSHGTGYANGYKEGYRNGFAMAMVLLCSVRKR